MKITRIKHYAVHPGWRKNLIFVKVETDAGIHGWGEAYSQYDRDTAVMAQLNALGPYMTGRSPFDIKHFTQFAFDDYAARRGSVELFCAISGIENLSEVLVRFRATVAGAATGSNRIDNVMVYSGAVPTPGALALLGIAGLVGRRRR